MRVASSLLRLLRCCVFRGKRQENNSSKPLIHLIALSSMVAAFVRRVVHKSCSLFVANSYFKFCVDLIVSEL